MRKPVFVPFAAAFLTVYVLINLYIFCCGFQALPPGGAMRTVFVVCFIFVACSSRVGRLMERVWSTGLAEALIWTGSFWLGAMLYLFLAVFLLDVLRGTLWLIPSFGHAGLVAIDLHRESIAVVVSLVVLLLLTGGYLNAMNPRVTTLPIVIPKHAVGDRAMTIAVASDIHLGAMIGRRRFNRMIALINAMEADLVLLPGDIVDEDLGPVIRRNCGEGLRDLRSRLGVMASTGNHEYIGGAERACAYLGKCGVTVLRDSVARLENGVQVIGREDRSIAQFAGKRRKTLEELTALVDGAFPTILMDHQPFHLEEAEKCGVDLQLSGHTHHGQLWPLSMITKRVYDVSRGYVRKGNTHIYVSSGVGTWGPPMRIGSRPEIVKVVLKCVS